MDRETIDSANSHKASHQPGTSKVAGAFGGTLLNRACMAAILARDAWDSGRLQKSIENTLGRLFNSWLNLETAICISKSCFAMVDSFPHVAASPQVIAQASTNVVHEANFPDILNGPDGYTNRSDNMQTTISQKNVRNSTEPNIHVIHFWDFRLFAFFCGDFRLFCMDFRSSSLAKRTELLRICWVLQHLIELLPFTFRNTNLSRVGFEHHRMINT